MSLNANALVAPANWPEESLDDTGAVHAAGDPPWVFAVLFGAHVIRVAGDGSLTVVVLPAEIVVYLRTGKPHPTMGGPRAGAGRPRKQASHG